MKLNEFILGYITCALFSSGGMDDDCDYLDEKYDSDDLAPEARKPVRKIRKRKPVQLKLNLN